MFKSKVLISIFIFCLLVGISDCNDAEQDSYFMNKWFGDVRPKLYCWLTKSDCQDTKDTGMTASYPEVIDFDCLKLLSGGSIHYHCKNSDELELLKCSEKKCKGTCKALETFGKCKESTLRPGMYCRAKDCSSLYFDISLYTSIGLAVLGVVFLICLVGLLCLVLAALVFGACIIWQQCFI